MLFNKIDESKHVVFVDSNNKLLGIGNKYKAHNNNTRLHRGFSCFIIQSNNLDLSFNEQDYLLITKRSSKKKTWPNFWSNSFCGHPQLDENIEDAVLRHAKFELGLNLNKDFLVKISDYQYKFKYNNIIEHEICPIFIYYINNSDYKKLASINFNQDEVAKYQWIKWRDFIYQIKNSQKIYTPWCQEEALIIEKQII